MHRTLSVALALPLFLSTALAHQDFSRVEIKSTPVAGAVHMLQGAGGNIGVSAGPDGLLIVDDQFAPLADKIDAALKGLSPGELKFVLNTHHHGDHTGGNPHFGQRAPIVAHANVRKRLAGNDASKPGLPVVTYEDSLSIHFNGEEIRLVHLPAGHTDCDSFVHFTRSNVVHMGDQFFSGRFPNIDLSSGGDVRGYIRNVQHAIETLPQDAKYIPGHGPLSTMKELKEFHEMLVETSAVVEKAIADGKTLPETKAAGLPERWKSWEAPTLNTGRWIEILYTGLTRKKE